MSLLPRAPLAPSPGAPTLLLFREVGLTLLFHLLHGGAQLGDFGVALGEGQLQRRHLGAEGGDLVPVGPGGVWGSPSLLLSLPARALLRRRAAPPVLALGCLALRGLLGRCGPLLRELGLACSLPGGLPLGLLQPPGGLPLSLLPLPLEPGSLFPSFPGCPGLLLLLPALLLRSGLLRLQGGLLGLLLLLLPLLLLLLPVALLPLRRGLEGVAFLFEPLGLFLFGDEGLLALQGFTLPESYLYAAPQQVAEHKHLHRLAAQIRQAVLVPFNAVFAVLIQLLLFVNRQEIVGGPLQGLDDPAPEEKRVALPVHADGGGARARIFSGRLLSHFEDPAARMEGVHHEGGRDLFLVEKSLDDGFEDHVRPLRAQALALPLREPVPEPPEGIHVIPQAGELFPPLVHEPPADAFYVGEVHPHQLPSVLRV
mmetsp:Transcript_2747/g.7589  ORF Transcript_2747/g.7589 Transcript_2747/m.7589 type:complete len:425 (+) Transcript_2747:645-1919(+)